MELNSTTFSDLFHNLLCHRLLNGSTDPLHGMAPSELMTQTPADSNTVRNSRSMRSAFLEICFQPYPVRGPMTLAAIICVLSPGCSCCSHSLWSVTVTLTWSHTPCSPSALGPFFLTGFINLDSHCT